jgi:hypothetical protein
MNRSWKRLAECADNEAFSVADIAGAFIPALEQSCREEVPDALLQQLKRIFGDLQRPLFEQQKVEEIAALRSTCKISGEWTHLISFEWDHPISG